MRLPWPLTGRAEELRLIESAVSEPDSSGIVISGAAGVGKSRLAREALAVATSRGRETRWLVGTSAARALPLGALTDWVGATESGDLEVVRSVIAALTASHNGTPVVIGVDDVALLDDLSTFVVHQIVSRGSAKVVLTVRDGDPTSSATRDLWGAGRFGRLALQPLSRKEVTDLVSSALDAPLDLDSADRLWRLTRGNALYLRNIVDHEFFERRLVKEHGYWRLIDTPEIPPGLVEIIEARLGALHSGVGDVVDALAVAEPLGLDELTRIAGPEAVEEADVRGLITVETGDRGLEVRVAHPLYGEVRRRRSAPTRLRRLRGLIATHLASAGGADDVQSVVRRAQLSLESDLALDADLLTAAARGAVSLADMPLADRLADAAIRAGAGLEAYFTRSWALAWSDPEQSSAVLAAIPAGDLDEEGRAYLAGNRAMSLLWGLADPDGAKAVIDAASRDASMRTRSVIDALYVMYWASMAHPDAARTSASGLALGELPGLTGAATSWALGVAYGDSGLTTDALAVFDEGDDIVTRTGQAPHMRYLIADRRLGVLLQAGLIEEAESLAGQVQSHAMDLPGVAQLLSTAIAGRQALGGGRLREAHSLLGPAIDTFLAGGDVNGLGYRYQIADTIALGTGGETEAAVAALRRLEQHYYPSYRFVFYEHDLARAWVAASRDATTEAIEICLLAAETARANKQFAAEVVCLQTATQFGDRSCSGRLRELTDVVEGPRVALAAQFATAMHRGDAAGLVGSSEEFERMGDVIAAVDAAAHAALTYRRLERRGSALACSTRAESLAEQCGASTPALRLASDRLPLTGREREIVKLIGQRLSSRQIAERLTLSRRTVEGHIYRAMAKTGVSTREELAALLSPRDGLA